MEGGRGREEWEACQLMPEPRGGCAPCGCKAARGKARLHAVEGSERLPHRVHLPPQQPAASQACAPAKPCCASNATRATHAGTARPDVSVTCRATPPEGSSRATLATLKGCRTGAASMRQWLRWQPLAYSRLAGTSSRAAGGGGPSAGRPAGRCCWRVDRRGAGGAMCTASGGAATSPAVKW